MVDIGGRYHCSSRIVDRINEAYETNIEQTFGRSIYINLGEQVVTQDRRNESRSIFHYQNIR